MEIKKFKFATDAAESILPMGLQWDIFTGQPVEREEFIMFANCLDLQNPLYQHPECFYVVNEKGSLGMTVNDCQHIDWLARIVVPELPEVKMPPIAETPMMVVKDEIHDSVQNAKQLFTFKGIAKKAIITAVSMLVIWIFTIAWQRMCVYNDMKVSWIAKTINYLTFAGGGFSKNIFYVIGGMVGKTFFMATLLAFVMGGYKKVAKGFSVFMDNLKGIDMHNLRNLAFIFAGMGAACFMVNFFMGYAVMRKTMICFVGVAGMLWAMGGGINFIRRMTVACTADVQKQTKVRYIDMPNTMRALSGMAIGFLVSFLLAWLLGGWTLYIFGTIFFVVGAALASVARQNEGKEGRLPACENPNPAPQAPNQPQYAPNQGQQYAPNQPQYVPNQGQQYAPNQGQYAPNQGQYAPNQGQQYAPNQGQYAPNQPQYAPNQPPYPENAPNQAPQPENAPNQPPQGGSGTAMPLLIALLLTIPFGLSASNWYLERVGVHTYKDPDADYANEEYELYDGRHVTHYLNANGDHEYDMTGEVTCTTPPSTIRKGDNVSLTVSGSYSHVTLDYNFDSDGMSNPPFGKTWTYRTFEGSNGLYGEASAGKDQSRTVSLLFDDEDYGDLKNGNITIEAPKGTQLAIIFHSSIGETRWIYEYHSDGHLGAAVDEEEEEGYEEEEEEGYGGPREIKLPFGPSFKIPDDYGFLSEPETMANWVSSLVGATGALILGTKQLVDPDSPIERGEGEEPTSPRTPRPSDPYVKRRRDGTIEYTNPITGEKEFLPPGTDEEALRQQVEHVLRNRQYYEDAYKKEQDFRKDERARVQQEIKERNEEFDRNAAKREAERIRKEKEPWLQDRMEKYGVESEQELRRTLKQEQGEAGAEYWKQMSKSHDAESGYIAAKAVKDSADVLMDAAAAYGGTEAQIVRDAYKVATEMGQSLTDAHLKGQNLGEAALAGAGRAGITVLQYHTGDMGTVAHGLSTIGGEGTREVINSLQNGKSLPEALKDGVKGMKRGAKDFIVDKVTGAATDKVKGFAGNEYTGKIVDTVGAVADDAGKLAGDNAMTPGGYGSMDS